MNLVALIGEVASEVREAGDGAAFALAVIGRRDRGRDVLKVQVSGAQGRACIGRLGPGHRVAVEGRVIPDGVPAEVLAERVQFLTTRAQTAASRPPVDPSVSE